VSQSVRVYEGVRLAYFQQLMLSSVLTIACVTVWAYFIDPWVTIQFGKRIQTAAA